MIEALQIQIPRNSIKLDQEVLFVDSDPNAVNPDETFEEEEEELDDSPQARRKTRSRGQKDNKEVIDPLGPRPVVIIISVVMVAVCRFYPLLNI